jgi:lysophospholipase L1-like esterase
MNRLKYLLGAFLLIPCLPLLILQGRRVRKSVPVLPEAKGNNGVAKSGGDGGEALRLMAIGESTMAGVGVETHEEGFAASFAQTVANAKGQDVRWKVYARSGYTAHRVQEKILKWIKEDHFDIIVIGLGGNDAFTLNRPWRWKQDMALLTKKLIDRFPQADIVISNMPPIKTFPAFTPLIKFFIGNLVEILGKEVVSIDRAHPQVYFYDHRITLDDWITRLKVNAQPEDFFSDGVHPSKLTYHTWGRDLASFYLDRKASLG